MMMRWASFGVLAVVVAAAGTTVLRGQSAPNLAPSSPVLLVAVDAGGVQGPGLGRDDFAVTVDGQPRQVLRVESVFRGPGAEAAARRAIVAGRTGFVEPIRTVVIAVDETRLPRGGEGAVREAAGVLLDRL
jgi:hypothetical protein